MAAAELRVQRGALVAQAPSGCLSPQPLQRLLCFDSARSAPGDGEEELPFYLAAPEALQDLVCQVRSGSGGSGGCWPCACSIDGREHASQLPWPHIRLLRTWSCKLQGQLPCPALWVDAAAAASGTAHLRALYRLGGGLQHCALPGKPLRLQPVKQAGSGSARGSGGGGSARGAAPAARAFLSARRHTQLYRLVAGLFPKLEQLHQELQGGAVALADPRSAGLGSPGRVVATPVPQVRAGARCRPWDAHGCCLAGGHGSACAAPSAFPVRASAVGKAAPRAHAPMHPLCVQGVRLERVGAEGDVQQLTIAVDFQHACLVLRDAPAARAAEPHCLRSVNSLAEALAVLHRESGRLGPSLTASPVKGATSAGGAGAGSSPGGAASPAKPPLPAAHGSTEALRLAVDLIQACGGVQLREGLAILSAAAGNSQACAAAIGFGALEALVTAAATVLPSHSVGMSELQPGLTVAVAGLLDAAPPGTFAAGRLVSILAAVLQQACANPLLLCRLLVALLQRADVRAEAMRQGLAGVIADVYVRLSPTAAAAAAELFPPTQQQQQQAQQAQQQGGSGTGPGFGSPLVPAAGRAAAENEAAVGNGRGRQGGQVASLVAAYNAMSDGGSDCGSPSSSRSPSPVKVGRLVGLGQWRPLCTAACLWLIG